VEDKVKMMLLSVITGGEGWREQLEEVILVALPPSPYLSPPLPPSTYLFAYHRRELEGAKWGSEYGGDKRGLK
jgi:hypothetical protein